MKKPMIVFIISYIFCVSISAKNIGCFTDAEDIFLNKGRKAKSFFRKKLFSTVSRDKLDDDELIISMINKNPDLMFYQNELQSLKRSNQLHSFRVVELVSLERTYTHPTYSTYTAQVKYRVKGEIKTREAYFRTNNKVVIPYPEQRLKTPSRKDYVAYRNRHGNIEHKDLTSIIIDSLDDTPKFSRGMNEVEYNLWKKNKLDEIHSGRNSGGTVDNPYPWKRYKTSIKTHFALEGFDFYGKPHIDFNIPKSVLRSLHKKGYLRITPYTSNLNIPTHGMPEVSRTAFGLEVEFIVYTEEGRKLIAPYIQAGIK
jgi:hypothetical protein